MWVVFDRGEHNAPVVCKFFAESLYYKFHVRLHICGGVPTKKRGPFLGQNVRVAALTISGSFFRCFWRVLQHGTDNLCVLLELFLTRSAKRVGCS